MRTTQLKIGKEKNEAILVAGGSGFKIYSATGISGWVVVIRRQIFIIDEKDENYKTVSRYVNLNYQPANQQHTIKDEFDKYVLSKALSIDKTITEKEITS